MIKSRTLFLAIIFAMVLSPNLLAANFYGVEFATNTGSTSNLLDDASKIYDVYSTSTLQLSLYPLSSLELKLGGQQSYYRETIGLSNITGQMAFTFVPTPRTSRFALYLSGNFRGLRYHRGFDGFDNNTGGTAIAVGYDITSSISVRTGMSYNSTSYIDPELEDKEDVEYYWGGNLTLPGSIGLDIESGFARANYSHVYLFADTSDFLISLSDPGTMLRPEKLWVFYYTPRISRMIAPKTGLNITFTKRKFQNYNGQLIFGFSTGFLSPWASVWEGQSVAALAKSYLIPKLIVSAGVGYWDKTYLRAIEKTYIYYIELILDQHNITPRHDWQTKYYASIQWPISTKSGKFIEPSIRVDYIKNFSNQDLFTYSDYSFAATITFRL